MRTKSVHITANRVLLSQDLSLQHHTIFDLSGQSLILELSFEYCNADINMTGTLSSACHSGTFNAGHKTICSRHFLWCYNKLLFFRVLDFLRRAQSRPTTYVQIRGELTWCFPRWCQWVVGRMRHAKNVRQDAADCWLQLSEIDETYTVTATQDLKHVLCKMGSPNNEDAWMLELLLKYCLLLDLQFGLRSNRDCKRDVMLKMITHIIEAFLQPFTEECPISCWLQGYGIRI